MLMRCEFMIGDSMEMRSCNLLRQLSIYASMLKDNLRFSWCVTLKALVLR